MGSVIEPLMERGPGPADGSQARGALIASRNMPSAPFAITEASKEPHDSEVP